VAHPRWSLPPRTLIVACYLRLRRSMRVRARSFLYLCLRIFFRRFLTTLLIRLLPLIHYRPSRPKLSASPLSVPHLRARENDPLHSTPKADDPPVVADGILQIASSSRIGACTCCHLAYPGDLPDVQVPVTRGGNSHKRPLDKMFDLVQVAVSWQMVPAEVGVYFSHRGV
jgi:hypothetical protein